jgi:hypothetical protein
MQTPISSRIAAAAQPVVSRLLAMRQLWIDAAEHYFEPDRFQVLLQNCIITSRTVTFILQSNKHAIDGFEEWYGNFAAAFARDPIMVWAKNARNTIEKEGDLKTYSQVRASIIAAYVENPSTNWIPQNLFASPNEIYRSVPKKYFIPHIVEHGTLLIERRWVDSELPDVEVLEALAHVYRNLANMVVESLQRLSAPVPASVADMGYDVMAALEMDRAIYLSMRDGSLQGFRYFTRTVSIDAAKIERRYGISGAAKRLATVESFHDLAAAYFEHARVVMLRDGYHISICLFFRGTSLIRVIDFTHPDRASRYVILHDLAKLSRVVGADGVVLISEVWRASKGDIPKSGFAVDAPNRTEGIMLNAINATGERCSVYADIERRKLSKKIKRLGATIAERNDFPFLLYPFMREWGCIDGESLRRGLVAIDEMGIETPTIPADAGPPTAQG